MISKPGTESMPNSRRRGRWLVASGIGLSFVSGICVGMWYWLPYVAPDWVMRHSPWLEPVVRTRMYYADVFNGGIDHLIQNPDPYLYQERMDAWGPTLVKELAPLLHTTPGMREAALESYPLQVPLADRSKDIREPKDWERVVVNVQPISDVDRLWFRARVNNSSYELGSPQGGGMAKIQAIFDKMRSVADSTVHPSLLDRPILKVTIELRIDAHVPFWLVDRLISTANEHSRKPGEQDFALWVVTTTAAVGRTAERELRTTFLPTPAAAHLITLVPHATAGDDAGVDVVIDGGAAEYVGGALNSQGRRDGIVRAIALGLPAPAARRTALCVRGGPLTPWADVVAGLDGARIANEATGGEGITETGGAPTTRPSLTIGPVFTGR